MLKILVPVAALALLAVPATADPGGKAHKGGPRNAEVHDGAGAAEMVAGVLIGAAERALIRDYYVGHRTEFTGGRLPPGIAKNLARGKPLPPGIAKKMPGGLLGRLPHRPGYEYRVVGPDVLLVEVATGVIADLVRDIFR